jgi:hypothetical protein
LELEGKDRLQKLIQLNLRKQMLHTRSAEGYEDEEQAENEAEVKLSTESAAFQIKVLKQFLLTIDEDEAECKFGRKATFEGFWPF